MHLPGKQIQFVCRIENDFSNRYEFSFTGQIRIDKLLVSMNYLKIIVCSLSKGCVKPYTKKKRKKKLLSDATTFILKKEKKKKKCTLII